jgi:hypothetical protein
MKAQPSSSEVACSVHIREPLVKGCYRLARMKHRFYSSLTIRLNLV